MMPKATYLLVLMAATTVIFATRMPVFASTETDIGIESSFEKSYVYTTYLADDVVRIDAVDGVVTLTGTVSEEPHKTLAQDTAASLPGVVRVDNQLLTDAEADAQDSDTWIGREVKLALMFHRNVSGLKTTVEVKDGVVTLKGRASSEAQRELTTEYAKDIDGVKEVKNEMTLRSDVKVTQPPETEERTPAEKIDDASITAQVKLALTMHRSTNAISTNVETRDGEVTLTGIAKNDAEKALVTKLVTDIQGVNNVKNEMTVKEVTTQ